LLLLNFRIIIVFSNISTRNPLLYLYSSSVESLSYR
jgi:hypothetical protein